MSFVRVAALAAAVSLGVWARAALAAGLTPFYAGGGNPQAPTVTTGMCGTSTVNGITVGIPCTPGVAPSDPNNAAFHGLRALTPSGTAGTAGTIAGAPYPSTSGGATATAATAGYSFSHQCTGAGTIQITTTDGSVVPLDVSASGGMVFEPWVILDAEPGTASGCSFGVNR